MDQQWLAASKNYKYVTVITNPSDYEDLANELDKNDGSTSLGFRKMSEMHLLKLVITIH